LSAPTAAQMWAPACRRFLVHDGVLSHGGLCTHEMRRLALWSLWSGTCTLPLHLAAAMAARALQDFKLQGFGPQEANVKARDAILQRYGGADFSKNMAFTRCSRSLKWCKAMDSDDEDDDVPIGTQDAFQNIPVQEKFEGYGELDHDITVGVRLGDCTVTLKTALIGQVDERNESSSHSGKVVVHFGRREPGQFQRRRDGETLLSWGAHGGDECTDEEDESTLDSAVLHRFTTAVFPACEVPFSQVEVVQFLWRLLGAPLRWSETLHPYAEHPTFYTLLRDVFFRCLLRHHDANAVIDDGEAFFVATTSGKDDSDFMNDVAAVRERELKVRSNDSEMFWAQNCGA